ncbi:MAG: Leucine dehydrogenase [Anaerolineales bacterium]|nr:Leucine dehydrogenase [Anaerolineales bacterium]
MLDVTNYMAEHGHEELVTYHDRESGLRALIAVHNTTLGPSLGGTRLWRYENSEAAMLDVLRLSEGMTYKAAVAGLHLGGGKSVIMADGKEQDPQVRAARLKAFGIMVERMGGRYIAAEDVGTTTSDILTVRGETKHVAGLPPEVGGSGDPSPVTAFGVMQGLHAVVQETLRTDSFKGVRVSIQGLGKVGMSLASRLVAEGALVKATDIRSENCRQAAEQFGVEIVQPEAIYDVECDIFAPCALGGVINDQTLPRLKCKIIAGSANNQLEDDRHGEALYQSGIVYAVDYVINAGGLINVAHELHGYNEEKAMAQAGQIFHTVKKMLALARTEGVSEVRAAHQMAQDRLKSGVIKSHS